MTEQGIPRRGVESRPEAQLMDMFRRLRADVDGLQRGSSLRNASISGGDGLAVLDPDGNVVLRLSTADGGGVVAYDPGGTEAARFGPLVHTAPGEYGVEVNAGDSWVRLGYATTSWAQVAGRPGEPGGATIPGTFITGTVPAASTATTAGSATTAASATTATKAGQADGSQYGWTNTVAGTEFYQVWVGNDGGFHFGRNVSSLRYKENIRDAPGDPKAILKLRPVLYDRIPKSPPVLTADGEPAIGPVTAPVGSKNEYGLIAEETFPHLPEVVTHFDGQIDGIRYELVGVAAIPVLQDHEDRIATLEKTVKDQAALIERLIAHTGMVE